MSYWLEFQQLSYPVTRTDGATSVTSAVSSWLKAKTKTFWSPVDQFIDPTQKSTELNSLVETPLQPTDNIMYKKTIKYKSSCIKSSTFCIQTKFLLFMCRDKTALLCCVFQYVGINNKGIKGLSSVWPPGCVQLFKRLYIVWRCFNFSLALSAQWSQNTSIILFNLSS